MKNTVYLRELNLSNEEFNYSADCFNFDNVVCEEIELQIR
jgi:hypothetical protein